MTTLPGTYIVEKILDKRSNGNKIEYKVKWEGYSDSENTWEPLKNLLSVQGLIYDFERENPHKAIIDRKQKIDKRKENNNNMLSKKRQNLKSTNSESYTERDLSQSQVSQMNKNNFNQTLTKSQVNTLNDGNKANNVKSSKSNENNDKTTPNNNLELIENEKANGLDNSINNSSKSTMNKETISTVNGKNNSVSIFSINPDQLGNLETDIPIKITEAKILRKKDVVLNCKIEFEKRKDGVKPEDNWFFSTDIRQKYPILLLDYLIQFVKFE